MVRKIEVSSEQKKRAIEAMTRIAKEMEAVLDQYNNLESAIDPLRKIIDHNLGDHEYLCLFDLDGLALVHSNRLQEGRYFNSEIALKAARSPEPITQVYHSASGKLLLDEACPVLVKGKHIYTVRAGVPFRKVYFSRQIFLGMLPLLLLGGGWVVSSSFSPLSIFLSICALLIQGLYSNWLKNKLSLALNEAFRVTKAIAKGDLNVLAKARSEDELGDLAYEMNKVVLGVKSIISELASVSEKSRVMSQTQASHTQTLAENQQSLAAIFEEFSAGASEQMDGMKIAQHQVEEIQFASRNILESAQEVLILATSTKSTSGEGSQAVKEAIREMGIIYNVTEQANQAVHSLAEQAQKIEVIVSVINDISAQTNLLALNAAIEAARAGEHGRGFAVVAEEVRKLADNSAQYSNHIMKLISNIREMITSTVENMGQGMNEVNKGREVIEKTGEAISFLNEVINKTEIKIEENFHNAEKLLSQSQILVETQQQATNIAAQFAEGAHQAATTVDQQMGSTEKVAAISSELAKISVLLNKTIQRFQW